MTKYESDRANVARVFLTMRITLICFAVIFFLIFGAANLWVLSCVELGFCVLIYQSLGVLKSVILAIFDIAEAKAIKNI